MILRPNPFDSQGQKIHRYFSGRLQSDSRFLAFYSDTISTICGDPNISAPDFVKIPLVINGTQHPPLGSFFDQARKYLNPREPGGLRDLPAAFGLGDGHGGNVMGTPGGQSTDIMHIDYEVSGTHCPFLDMAKAMYNDGFFNAFYGDLLSDNLSSKPNASGITVAWSFSPEVIRVDYEADVGDVGKVIAVTKLEYILVPLLQLVAEKHDSSKVDLAEKVLGHALLACALLTRNFSKRPDLLFLNLALGVRLAADMRRVFAETFGWVMPRVEDWSAQPSNEVRAELDEGSGID
ncbi:hypothetical protein ColLi_10928 [Colletotrichum liriopes]|uniref:Uncharacterized protein n=1 Tax=Colletotrichum liriopes TaxID=708192 RepID=A0AA37LWN1_9PEZI|nr:hypothetical protein ColLi_10928 [Colletotrichum liriopes]